MYYLIQNIRNKRIQRLVKKTLLYSTTEYDIIERMVKQHYGSIDTIRSCLEHIAQTEKNCKNA